MPLPGHRLQALSILPAAAVPAHLRQGAGFQEAQKKRV